MNNKITVFTGVSTHPGTFAHILFPAIILMLAPLAMVGCKRDEIRVYTLPKEANAVPVATTSPSQAAAPSPPVIWTLPEDWAEVANTEPMRVATLSAGPENVEVSLSAFPGPAGGVLANVNRWRGQLGLDPVDEAGLVETMESSTGHGATVAIVDLQSPDGDRMLAAIVDPGDGHTWFVKAIGDTDPLESIIESFRVFSRSIRIDPDFDPHAGHNHPPGEHPEPAADEHAGHNHPPGEHPEPAEADEHAGHDHGPGEHGGPATAGKSPADIIAERLSVWAAPTNWAPEENISPILSAAFLADNDAGGARITVTVLVGDGGGDLANINRWRGQMGLAPVERLDQEAGVIRESPLVVDLATPDAADRMVAAIVGAGDATYYFKMMGSFDGAGAEMANFDRLTMQVGIGEGSQ